MRIGFLSFILAVLVFSGPVFANHGGLHSGPSTALIAEQSDTNDYSVYYQPYITKFKQKAKDGLAADTTITHGHTFGIIRNFDKNFKAGFEAILTRSKTDGDQISFGFTVPDKFSLNSYELRALAEYTFMGVTIKPSVQLGLDDYKQQRRDIFSGLTAFSKTSGWHLQGEIEAWSDFLVHDFILLRPIAGLEYTYTKAKGYTETGAGFFNLAVGPVNDNRLISKLGLTAAVLIPDGTGGTIAPFASIEWLHNFNTNPFTANVTFIPGPSLGKTNLFAGPDANGARINAGIFLQTKSGLDFYVAYQGEFFKNSTSHTAAASVGFSF